MKKIVKKYLKPGKWEVIIPFDKVGEEVEWLAVVDGREVGEYELTVIAEHRVPGTRGRITGRAIAGPNVYVKLKGIIKIGKEATETDDFLELRVLILDKTAKVITEPELEILTNNVKASHATSVGPIELEQLLYLMSRGLNVEQARSQVIEGWLGV